MDWLAGPHVSRCWFGEFDLPTGYAYLHNGVGRVTVGGHEYRGISDPIGGQLVAVNSVEDPRFGQAAKVEIVIAGANAAFWKSVKTDARDIEGRTAVIKLGAFDAETGEVRLFKQLLSGYMTSPKLSRQGIGTRYIIMTIENSWEGQNFPFGGKWTDADQRRRYAGDKGLQFVGVKVSEQWE